MAGPELLMARFPAIPPSLKASRNFIRSALVSLNLKDHETDIQLAIGEVMQNIIRHGYGGGDSAGHITVKIHFNEEEGQFSCWIRDTAPPAHEGGWIIDRPRTPATPENGGIGLGLIHAIAERYEITPGEAGNLFHLVFAFRAG